MLTAKTWDDYNQLGILDIVEFFDPTPTIYFQGDEAKVHYRTPDGIYQRDLRRDSDGWWHYAGGDYEAGTSPPEV